jgi:hypothetical protein
MNARRLRPSAGRNGAPQLHRRKNRRSGSIMGVPPRLGSDFQRLVLPTLKHFAPKACLDLGGTPAHRGKCREV